jgi:hypothetical protein
MYPASTPLVPDDQFHERDFAPRDLDAERDLNDQRRRRPQRPKRNEEALYCEPNVAIGGVGFSPLF